MRQICDSWGVRFLTNFEPTFDKRDSNIFKRMSCLLLSVEGRSLSEVAHLALLGVNK